MKRFIAAIFVATVTVSAPVESAAAREFKDIVQPYYDRYGKWQDVRKAMRKRLKNGEAFTGDDWFTLASVCAIQPPQSQSIILSLTSKSPCRKQTVEYFVKAAEAGTPRGYLQASKWVMLLGGTAQGAWPYAALAYRFSTRDADLATDARAHIAELGYTPSEGEVQAVNRMAMQLVANGVYPGDGQSSDVRLADLSGPDLSWLNFKNPKRCEWGDDAWLPFVNSVRVTRSGGPWQAFPTKLPDTGQEVGVRIIRNEPVQNEPFEYDFEGRWNGLRVVGLRSGSMKGYPFKYSGTAMRFRDPVSVVAPKLADLGFPVNADGSLFLQEKPRRERYSGPDGSGVATVVDTLATWVVRRGDETYFFCDQNDEWR